MQRAVVLIAALAATTIAAAAAPSLTLMPSSVQRGHTVSLTGSADGCPAGDTVLLLSKAFVHAHDFAGLPAVYAPVRRGGAFAVTTRIPRAKARGRYAVTGRCGGGNLGFVKHLTVRR